MRVVLDANVIVAAFAAHGLCEAVFEVCLDAHDLLVSDALIDEVGENLRKKIRLPEATVAAITRLLRDTGRCHCPVRVPSDACRDPGDLHVLGLAEAGRADCIITGDKDLLAPATSRAYRVLTPRQFSDLIHGKGSREP